MNKIMNPYQEEWEKEKNRRILKNRKNRITEKNEDLKNYLHMTTRLYDGDVTEITLTRDYQFGEKVERFERHFIGTQENHLGKVVATVDSVEVKRKYLLGPDMNDLYIYLKECSK